MSDAHQGCPITPFLNWAGERKYNKSLVGSDKDRETTHLLPSWAKQTQPGQINLIHYQSNQNKILRNKMKS